MTKVHNQEVVTEMIEITNPGTAAGVAEIADTDWTNRKGRQRKRLGNKFGKVFAEMMRTIGANGRIRRSR
jgi:hypothetical protein